MVSTVEITPDQARAILALEEGHFQDLKAVDIKPAKLTESVAAFANASGGEIFVGIDEQERDGVKTRSWRGFADVEKANAHFQVLEAMRPLAGHYAATFMRCTGFSGYVLHIEIPKSKDILKASDGHPYVRKGAQKLRLDTAEALHRLRLDKGIVSFEDDVVTADLESVTNSVTIIDFMLGVIPTGDPEVWLRKQSLIVNDKPTVAGVMLFHDEPQAALPKRTAVKIYRYRTRDDEGTREQLAGDPITIEGCAYNLIYEAVSKTKEIIQGIRKLTDKGLEEVLYPDETLHEIITNAVLHRDYSIPSDIHIRIYDNRVEVQSPGELPGHITTRNILDEQAARNPRLVRLINKFPNAPNKDVGEGLNTAFAAMKALRLKDPEIVETDTSVIVHIRHSPLASPQDAVMSYLEYHDEITNSLARELTGIRSENSMKEVFLSLNRRQLIERVPGKLGNKAAWRKWTGDGAVEEPEGLIILPSEDRKGP
jgi:ATP-dependent DNA helicase RecG